jgi:23S rRNA (pseudouridine1915-N3)-methyltransferase
MKLHVAFVSGRSGRTKLPGIAAAAEEFATRLGRFTPFDALEFADEDSLLQGVHQLAGRSAPFLVLLDSQGKQLSSEEIAGLINTSLDNGIQHLVFAVGGADGWKEDSRKQANLVLSLGRITLAHEIARVVLLEQLYRAFTILKGHPYHKGH